MTAVTRHSERNDPPVIASEARQSRSQTSERSELAAYPNNKQKQHSNMATQPSHDTGHKLLFSHARVVEDLLLGFVCEAWVEDLDFTSLEIVSSSYITDDLREREDELIRRVPQPSNNLNNGPKISWMRARWKRSSRSTDNLTNVVCPQCPNAVKLPSCPRRRASRKSCEDWIPAYAGMTKRVVAVSFARSSIHFTIFISFA